MPVIQGGYTNRLNYWDTKKDGPKPAINSNFFPSVRNGKSMMSRPNIYDPRNLPTLIGSYDFSNSASVIRNNNRINIVHDKTQYHNELQGVGYNYYSNIGGVAGVTLGFNLANYNANILGSSNRYLTNSYLQNNELSMRYRTDGITVFIVARLGYTVNGTDIISIFGSSNSSQVSSSNVLFIRTDSDNNIYATNGINNAGASIFIPNNYNERKLITGVFTTSDSTLTINGTVIGPISCGTVFSTDYNTFNLSIGTSGTKYNIYGRPISDIANSLHEVLVYNTVLTSAEISNIQSFLASKWSINYSVVSDVPRAIPGLISWLNTNNNNNIVVNNDAAVEKIYSSERLSNTFIIENVRSSYPQYSNNTISYSGDNPPIIGKPFTGTGTITGLTVSMIVRNLPLSNDSALLNGNIISGFTRSNIINSKYPAITNDKTGNIFLTSNAYYTTDPNNYSFNLGSINGNVKDYYILTATYSNWNTQLYINGYPMIPQQISSNLPTWNLIDPINFHNSNSQKFLLGGITYPDPNPEGTPLNNTCTTEIGETLIYKKVLNQDELNIVHDYMKTNNNILNAISSNGLVAWFDAADLIGNSLVSTWNSKVGSIALSNFSYNGGVPFARQFLNPVTGCNFSLVDFNNGLPSIMADLNNVIDLSPNNLNIFAAVTINSNTTEQTYINISNIIEPSVLLQSVGNRFISQSAVSGNNNAIINIVNLSKNSNDNIPKLYTIPPVGNNTQGFTQTLSSSNNNIIIGDDNIDGLENTPCQNSIGEILIYNRPLSNNEYTNILAYLQSKWTVPLFSRQDPVTIPDLLLWYDTNTLSDTDTAWSSMYGGLFGSNLIGIGANISNITGNKYLSVNDTTMSGFFSSDFLNISNSYTMFQVVRTVGTSGLLMCFSNSLENANILSPGIELGDGVFRIINLDSTNIVNVGDYSLRNNAIYDLTNSTCIICSSYNGTKYNTRVKGTLQEYTGTTFTYEDRIGALIYKLNIGAQDVENNINPASANIGEFMFYNRALNDIEKLSVFSYLEQKWINGVGAPPVVLPTTDDFNLTRVSTESSSYVTLHVTNTWGGQSAISYSYNVVHPDNGELFNSNVSYNPTTDNIIIFDSLDLDWESYYTVNVGIANINGPSESSNSLTIGVIPNSNDFVVTDITVAGNIRGQIQLTKSRSSTSNTYNYEIYDERTRAIISEGSGLPINTGTLYYAPPYPIDLDYSFNYKIEVTITNDFGTSTSSNITGYYVPAIAPQIDDFDITNTTERNSINATITLINSYIEPTSYNWSVYNTDDNSTIYGGVTDVPWTGDEITNTIINPPVNLSNAINYTIAVALTNAYGTSASNSISATANSGPPQITDFNIIDTTVGNSINASIEIVYPYIEPILSYSFRIYNTDNNINYSDGASIIWSDYETNNAIINPAVNIPFGSNYTIEVSLSNQYGISAPNSISATALPINTILEPGTNWFLEDKSVLSGDVGARVTFNNPSSATSATVYCTMTTSNLDINGIYQDLTIESFIRTISLSPDVFTDFVLDDVLNPLNGLGYSITAYVDTTGGSSSTATVSGFNRLTLVHGYEWTLRDIRSGPNLPVRLKIEIINFRSFLDATLNYYILISGTEDIIMPLTTQLLTPASPSFEMTTEVDTYRGSYTCYVTITTDGNTDGYNISGNNEL